LKYRSDIDGLRSIAVLLVILNHAGFTFLSGGFVGVDVFFVLSGYLITSIIAAKVKTESFDFYWFFVRRIKRLLPASFVVIFVTAIAFTFIMLPQDLVRFYKSIIWVVFYLGNIFFWREHGGYFGGDAGEAPLLHTWSLAVEEQYYLVWPVIILLSYRYIGPKRSLYFFAAFFVGMTVFSEWGTQVTIGAAYYLLPTRFFELMAGSLLALFWFQIPQLSTIVRNMLSVIGAVLIVGSAILLTEHHSFPGYNALYPVMGTVLLVLSQTGWLNRLLSLTPFVFIGKISYSMYLWHWPIFTFMRYSAIELTLPVQISCIALTFAVSVLSWRYVEQPFRESKEVRFKHVFLKMFLLPSIILSILAGIGIAYKGFPERFSSNVLQMETALNSHADISRQGCHAALRESENLPQLECVEYLPAQTNNSVADIFVIGDSHGNHFVPFLHELAKGTGLSIQDYTLDQCVPIFDMAWGRSAYKAEKCQERNQFALKHIQANNFKYVVLAASWPGLNTSKIYNNGERVTDDQEKQALLQEKLSETIELLLSLGIRPVVLEDTPDLGGKSPKCPLKQAVFDSTLSCSVLRPENTFFAGMLDGIKKEYSDIIIIKPRELICEGEVCQMAMGGIPLFRDDDHLNEMGASLMGKLFLEHNSNPFLD
jgi:peptidoglycan/LPS O-acetylase OafA/YrhL